MRTRIGIITRIGALVGVAGICWSAPALAQTSNTTKFTGTATGAGTVSRTIIDISEPNSPQEGGAGLLQIQAGSVTVPVTTGKTANQIARAFRDSINTNTSLAATGYSAAILVVPPGDSSRVKMTRQIGSFSVTDVETVPGVTMAIVEPTVEDAPALTPYALALLAAGLSALAYQARRQRRKA